MSATPLLGIRHLIVEFPARHGDRAAVRGLSLDVQPGEILGLVGESGAGKSATGAAVCGVLRPPGRIAGGEIRVRGERVDNLPEPKLRKLRGRTVGMIFQDAQAVLNPLYTIGSQLIETIRTHLDITKAAARARAIDLLDEVGMPQARQQLNAYPHELSGGMRQRVVIALALAPGPELLIADEPTSALDVSIQAQVLLRLERACRERGMSVVLVTHDLGVAAQVCDRIAVMYAGRIVEIGAVDTIIESPRHPYTCGLMSAIPPVDHRPARLTQIPGQPPRLDEIQAGCAFHPRCTHAMDICRREQPAMRRVDTREVECFLY